MILRIVLFLKFALVFERLQNRKKHKTSVDGQTPQKSVDLNALKEQNFYYSRFESPDSRLPRLRSGLFYSDSSFFNNRNIRFSSSSPRSLHA